MPAPPCLWWCLKVFSCLGKACVLFQTAQNAATQGCCVQAVYTKGSQDTSVVFYAHLCPPNYRHLILMWGLVCGSMAKCDLLEPPRQVLGNTACGCGHAVGLASAKGSAGWQGKKEPSTVLPCLHCDKHKVCKCSQHLREQITWGSLETQQGHAWSLMLEILEQLPHDESVVSDIIKTQSILK